MPALPGSWRDAILGHRTVHNHLFSMNSALISVAELSALMAADGPPPLVVDCSFDLADPQAGQRSFEAGHLSGAQYLDLDQVLSQPPEQRDGLSGRHPLPAAERLLADLAAVGANDDRLIVAYDASFGVYAARLWWLARWLGHDRVTLLDGGIAAWRAAGGAVQTGPAEPVTPGQFKQRSSLTRTVDLAEVRATLGQGRRLLVDARSPDRFRGENEVLDPIGGHIPGSANRWFRDNLGADGRFKPVAQLQQDWQAVMAGREAAELVQSCGSGVTACHNLLAMAVAGLPGAALFPGSWSQWCARKDAPIAVGD